MESLDVFTVPGKGHDLEEALGNGGSSLHHDLLPLVLLGNAGHRDAGTDSFSCHRNPGFPSLSVSSRAL